MVVSTHTGRNGRSYGRSFIAGIQARNSPRCENCSPAIRKDLPRLHSTASMPTPSADDDESFLTLQGQERTLTTSFRVSRYPSSTLFPFLFGDLLINTE